MVPGELNICLVGSGGVGTVAAVVLEKSCRAKLTAVLRSKYDIINEKGWDIESIDHRILWRWRPSRGENTCSFFESLNFHKEHGLADNTI
jgi:ketopantoate reductase